MSTSSTRLRSRSVLRVFLAQEAPGFQDLPWHGKGGRLKRVPISFGTDGVRGIANKGLLPEDALRLGLSASRVFGGRIVIGRDTRLSGEMLARALCAGLASG